MIDASLHCSYICNWEYCQEIQQKLHQHLPAHHVWNKTPIRHILAKANASRTHRTKSLSFRGGVFKHLITLEEEQIKCRAGLHIA